MSPVVVCGLQVYIDLKQVESGSLYDDFDMLPPKTIKVNLPSLRDMLSMSCIKSNDVIRPLTVGLHGHGVHLCRG